jgi:hypothetical protein
MGLPHIASATSDDGGGNLRVKSRIQHGVIQGLQESVLQYIQSACGLNTPAREELLGRSKSDLYDRYRPWPFERS